VRSWVARCCMCSVYDLFLGFLQVEVEVEESECRENEEGESVVPKK
jgi:hypothetical protein